MTTFGAVLKKHGGIGPGFDALRIGLAFLILFVHSFDNTTGDDAAFLDRWGEGMVWNEIQLLLANRKGTVLDLACGTGRTNDFLKHNADLEYHGCDIAPLLIEKAHARGIPPERLQVGDATKLTYADNAFDYLYSIGSLEHFTEAGIDATLAECKRVCSNFNFHLLPVSQSGFDEGWVVAGQSYWINSEAWWLNKFKSTFGKNIWTMSSLWGTSRMRSVWFITAKDASFVD